MEKQTLETKKIVHNNISYLQYDLAKDQAKTSFFDISDINAIKELRQEGLQEMHFLNLYSSNPQLSPSMSFLRVHVLSLLNYHIN